MVARRLVLSLFGAVVLLSAGVAIAVRHQQVDMPVPSPHLEERLAQTCDRPSLSDAAVAECVAQMLLSAVVDDARPLSVVNAKLATAVVDGAERVGFACHDALHALGEALASDGWLPDAVIAENTYGCYGGVWHGYFESLGVRTDADAYVETVAGACSRLAAAPEVLQFDCLHGLGHGLGMADGVPIADALEGCVRLVGADVYPSRDPVRDCATGVVSSYVSRATIPDHGPPPGPEFDAAVVVSSCASLTPFIFADACFERIAAVWVANEAFDAEAVYAACSKASPHAGACAYGFGRIGFAPEDGLCERFAELADDCYRGLVETWVPVALYSGETLNICAMSSGARRETCARYVAEREAFERDWTWVLRTFGA